jgi:hypothetical protein
VGGRREVLLEKLERKRPLGKPRLRWEGNIKMNLKEVVWGSRNCNDLAQDTESLRTLVNPVINITVP